MNPIYLRTLQHMERTLGGLEKRVPVPKKKPIGDSFVFRYAEQTIYQAMIQKLARLISCLHSAQILLEYGFIQEQAALQRMLDEFEEDIIFLAFAVVRNDITKLHLEYLSYFYEEEFDNPSNPIESTQKRPMVRREKIRAYIARNEGTDDPSTSIAARLTLHKGYSGYVHGASPQIMEMYGGIPPHFHVSGMRKSPLFEDHRDDLWNYFYRGICVFAIAAKAFGDDALFKIISSYADQFATISSKSDSASAKPA